MYKSEKGFTLLEVLVVAFIIGVIAALIAPTWFTFFEARRLTVVRDKIYVGIREAQTEAQSKRESRQFSVREHDNRIEWATHPRAIEPQLAQWKPVEDSHFVQLDDETTFDRTSEGVRYIVFDDDGNTDLRYLGRVTFSTENAPAVKRCVIASTIIGALRKSKEQIVPDPSYRTKERFCY